MLLMVIGMLGVSGCGIWSGDGEADPDLRPTLDATVTPGDDLVEDDVLDPAGLADSPPVLSFGASPVFCCNPLSIEFSAEISGDTYLTARTFEWDFGDGAAAAGAAPQHTYAWSGEYLVVLRVRLSDGSELVAQQYLTLRVDGSGRSDTILTPVSQDPWVQPSPDAASLTADAGPDQEAVAGAEVVLEGNVSGGDTGAEIAFVWSQASGLPVVLQGADAVVATFTAPHPGDIPANLLFNFTVTDGDTSDSDVVWVTVVPTADFPGTNAAPVVSDLQIDVEQNGSTELTLTGYDPDEDDLAFNVIRVPRNGTIAPADPAETDSGHLIYTPNENFVGVDTFTFRATDGLLSSNLGIFRINVTRLSTGPVAIDGAYLVPVETPVRLTMKATAEAGTDLTFGVVVPPVHGRLGAIDNGALQSAAVIYTPDPGFEGTDTFTFRAGDGTVEAPAARITLKVQKRLLPWMEVNSPQSTADSLYTAVQGAEPGMTRLDYCVAGIEHWAKVTDTVIVTTRPGQVDVLYPELLRRVPAHIRIIGGIKTHHEIPGVAPDDPRPYDFADADGWALIADEVLQVAQATGMDVVVLENETALLPFTQGQASIDLPRLAESLAALRDTGVHSWWWLPWVMSNDPESFPDRQVHSTALVAAVAQAVPSSAFLTEYASWYGWRSYSGVVGRREAMIDLVGLDRVQDGLFVTPDGYVDLPEERKRAYTVEEALSEVAGLSGEAVRLYPGGSNWILVGREMAAVLPPLADTIADR